MAKALVCIAVSFIMAFPAGALAQQRSPQGESSSQVPSPRRQMATIVYSGLGGLVLGLSTLSFYGRPQDHMSNIGMGFAIGVIIGAAYTTYQAASAHRALGGPGLSFYETDFLEQQGQGSELWAQLQEGSALQSGRFSSDFQINVGLWSRSF